MVRIPSLLKFKTLSLGEKQRQWLWFAGLMVGGMAAMLMVAGLVRIMLKLTTS
jgi:hypothetical protein